VRGATVSVLFVPLAAAISPLTGRPLLVALDGSSQAELGLKLARNIVGRSRSEIHLVETYYLGAPVRMEFLMAPIDLLGSMENAAKGYLQSTARDGERTIIALGPADAVIDDAAQAINAGLVVVTSRGRRLAMHLALGSTTDRLLHAIRRPLLVVPLPAPSQAPDQHIA